MSRKPAKGAKPLAAPPAGVTMRQALTDPALLGDVLAGVSWRTWIVLLVAIMGEPLTDEERVIFKALTGRDREPGERAEEFWAVIGRRGGKSRAIAVLIVFIAVFVDHRSRIVPGEESRYRGRSSANRTAGPRCSGLRMRHHRIDGAPRADDPEQDGRVA